MRLKEAIAFQGVRAAIGAGSILPRSVGARLFEAGGELVHLLERNGRERARRNLALVYGNAAGAERTARRVYRDLGRNAYDLVRLEKLEGADLEALVEPSGMNHLEGALSSGLGVIGVAGHLGNWELMAAYLGRRGVRLTALAARLFDPRLDAWLVRMRARHGVASLLRSEPACLRRAIRVLKGGEMLGVLMDLRCRREGIVTEFLGRPARTEIGPVRLAARTGSLLVPMGCWRIEGGRYRVAIERPIEPPSSRASRTVLEETATQCLRVLEGFIHGAPTQWVWMHDRWTLETS
ncbi:MAG: lysophospholipid acyltransferase family protein [Candidatus Eisenbacteria bacterium]|nr:lysophospholipid acyltransferase family protein [Candidatus Eisenbacteria bacterium]